MRKRKKPTGVDVARAMAKEQRKSLAAMGTFIANRIRRGHPELRGWSCVTVDGRDAYGKCQRCGNGLTCLRYTRGLRLFRHTRYVKKPVGFTIISGPEVCVHCMREEVERGIADNRSASMPDSANAGGARGRAAHHPGEQPAGNHGAGSRRAPAIGAGVGNEASGAGNDA